MYKDLYLESDMLQPRSNSIHALDLFAEGSKAQCNLMTALAALPWARRPWDGDVEV